MTGLSTPSGTLGGFAPSANDRPGGMNGPRTERLFLAALPDEAAARRIDAVAQALRRDAGLHGAPIGVDRYHVTLLFLGDCSPDDAAERVRRVAEGLDVRGHAPFDVSFDRIAAFGRRTGRAPVVLRASGGVDRLAALHERLRTSTGSAVADGRPYTPHLTLMYDEGRVAERPIEPIGWTVREVVLVHSRIGRQRHTVLGRWPLQA